MLDHNSEDSIDSDPRTARFLLNLSTSGYVSDNPKELRISIKVLLAVRLWMRAVSAMIRGTVTLFFLGVKFIKICPIDAIFLSSFVARRE